MTTIEPKRNVPPDLDKLAAEQGVKPMTAQEFAQALRDLFEDEEDKQKFLERFDRFWPNEPDG